VLAFAVDPGLVRTSMTELQLFSDAGKTYLPNIQELFDNGVNVPPSRAAALIADIAAGRFDPLAGRLLRGVDDRELLEQEMEDIVSRASAASIRQSCRYRTVNLEDRRGRRRDSRLGHPARWCAFSADYHPRLWRSDVWPSSRSCRSPGRPRRRCFLAG
jgi:hypothetical protein